MGSEGELAPAERRRAEVQSHIAIFLLGLMFGLTGIGMVNMVFLTCCAEEMGATTIQFSVIPALWGLSTMPIFFLAFWVTRVRRLKAFCLWWLGVTALTGLGFCLILALPLPAGTGRVWAMLGAALLGQFVSNIFFAGWFAWLPHFVRKESMGRFQSIRLMVMMSALMLSYAAGGYYLTRFPGMKGFSGLFALGSVAGLLSMIPTARIPAPPRSLPPARGLRPALQAVVGCRPLMYLFAFMTLYNGASLVTGVLPTVFMKRDLSVPYDRLGLYTALGSWGMLTAILAWGRMVDRYGGRRIMGCASGGMIGVCLLWALNAPGRTTTLPFAHFFGGAVQAAFSVSWLPLVYAVTPAGLRGMVGSVGFLTWGVPGVISPFVGGQIVDRLAGVRFEVMGADAGAIHILFLLLALGFAVCLPMLRFIRGMDAGKGERREGGGEGSTRGEPEGGSPSG